MTTRGSLPDPMPTGFCYCGCGQVIAPGRFFVASHDRRAESKMLKEQYGGIASFVAAHNTDAGKPPG